MLPSGAAHRRQIRERIGATVAARTVVLVALAVGAAVLFLVLSPRGGATEAVQKGQVSTLAKGSTATPPAVNNAEAPAPVMGRIVPDFTLETLDGQQVTLSRLRGKPV